MKDVNLVETELFIDTGEGFKQANSLAKSASSQGPATIEFDLSGFPLIQRLRFDPSHNGSVIKALSFTLVNNEGKILPVDFLSDAIQTQTGLHVFLDNDPKMLSAPMK